MAKKSLFQESNAAWLTPKPATPIEPEKFDHDGGSIAAEVNKWRKQQERILPIRRPLEDEKRRRRTKAEMRASRGEEYIKPTYKRKTKTEKLAIIKEKLDAPPQVEKRKLTGKEFEAKQNV